MEGEGLLARAFCHETDHLNGHFFLSHLSTLKRDLIKRKITEADQGRRVVDGKVTVIQSREENKPKSEARSQKSEENPHRKYSSSISSIAFCPRISPCLVAFPFTTMKIVFAGSPRFAIPDTRKTGR